MDLAKLVAWGVAAVLVILAAGRLTGGGTEPVPSAIALDAPAATAPAAAPGQANDAAAAAAPGGTLHVHVAGAVRSPGVYEVPAGARVSAAVDAAGGLQRRADPAGVNLAAPLQDGQQVLVPRRGQASAPAAGGTPADTGSSATGAGAPGAPGLISLSTATAAELETLDGIGPALAGRIIEYRDANGGFRSIEELQEVDGIGEKRFAALRDAVRP